MKHTWMSSQLRHRLQPSMMNVLKGFVVSLSPAQTRTADKSMKLNQLVRVRWHVEAHELATNGLLSPGTQRAQQPNAQPDADVGATALMSYPPM